jgi:hypothetical protein
MLHFYATHVIVGSNAIELNNLFHNHLLFTDLKLRSTLAIKKPRHANR